MLDSFLSRTRFLRGPPSSHASRTAQEARRGEIFTIPDLTRGSRGDRVSSEGRSLQKLRCYTGRMKTPTHPTTSVSDGGLIAELARLAACERRATSDLLRALMKFDARGLYLAEGYPSLLADCTQVLH